MSFPAIKEEGGIVDFPRASPPKRALPYLVPKKISPAKEEALLKKEHPYLTPQEVVLLARSALQSCSFSSTSATSQNASPVLGRNYRRISSQKIALSAQESLGKEGAPSSKVLPLPKLVPLKTNSKS